MMLKIRTMSARDLPIAIEWAAAEGWNPGGRDARCFYAADGDGFFLGEVDGEPVGCISAVRYCGDFGFLGLYIVRPEQRGRGYGMALWNHAMEYLDGCNIGLDGVLEQQGNYAKSGFKLAHRNIRYELPLGLRRLATAANEAGEKWSIVSLENVDQGALSSYDRKMFLYPRAEFLRQWTAQPGVVAFGVVDLEAQLQGYGVMRLCRNGYKIGPLFADSEEIGNALFGACVDAAGEATVYLDIPEPNSAALDLVKRHGMTPVFETARMYTHGDPGLPLDKIYGISSFELG